MAVVGLIESKYADVDTPIFWEESSLVEANGYSIEDFAEDYPDDLIIFEVTQEMIEEAEARVIDTHYRKE